MEQDKKIKPLYKKPVYGKTRKNIVDAAFGVKQPIRAVDPMQQIAGNRMPAMPQPFPMPPQGMGQAPMPSMEMAPPMVPPQQEIMPPQAPQQDYDPRVLFNLLRAIGEGNEPTLPTRSKLQ